MNRRRTVVTVIVLALLVALGWHEFHAAPEWRNFSWAAVWSATQGAKASFIVGAIVLTYVSYLLRSLRWSTLMQPHGRFWPILKGTLIGFTGVALFGRPGELVRPYYIARKHCTSVSPQLAVWLLERVFDLGAAVVLIGIDLLLNPSIKEMAQSGHYASALERAAWILAVLAVAIIALVFLFHRYSARVTCYVRRRLEGSHTQSLVRPVEHFLHMLARGTGGLTRRKNLILSAFYTLSLWMGIAVAVWLVVLCYPDMLPGFTYAEALLLLGFLLVGSVVQLPAIGGGVQVLIVLGLTEVFGAPAAPAASAALLIWLIDYYAVAPFGAALAAHEGISWRRLEREAELASD